MRLDMLFLSLMSITLVLAVLELMGYQVLEALVVMVVVDFIALGANIELRRRNLNKDSKDFTTSKLENIERICSDIFENITINPIKNFEKEKDSISYLLDKLSKKTLELEERVEKFGQSMLNSMTELNGRVKTLESSKPIESIEEQKVLEKGQEIPLGELIYIKEEKDE